MDVNDYLRIPDHEITWRFARSGGPGGQNVNKVESKATLFWNAAGNLQFPADAKRRLASLYPRFVNDEGVVVITSQRHRDQERNRQDCLDKLRAILIHALHRPRVRKKTRPTRGSKLARLRAKKHRAAIKSGRRGDRED